MGLLARLFVVHAVIGMTIVAAGSTYDGCSGDPALRSPVLEALGQMG